jgi:hypothetical protein
MTSQPILRTPHGDKLRALLANAKLPQGDADRIKMALSYYEDWLANLGKLAGEPADVLTKATQLLNEYRLFLDLEVVFDSSDDFLYRQKGQLKLDNTVLEEFLPHIVTKSLGSLIEEFQMGPQSCYSALYFSSTLTTAHLGPGIRVRAKDQDFAIYRKLYLRTSFDPQFQAGAEIATMCIGYICAECKTNLDKTMFQEAVATAHDVKTAVPGSRYLLLCEWLDMTPISPAGTDINEVLILRKSRRIGSQIRGRFATREGRLAARKDYERFLRDNPFSAEVLERLLTHIRSLLENRDPDEKDVLSKGYF